MDIRSSRLANCAEGGRVYKGSTRTSFAKSFEDEYVELLRLHDVEYDENIG